MNTYTIDEEELLLEEEEYACELGNNNIEHVGMDDNKSNCIPDDSSGDSDTDTSVCSTISGHGERELSNIPRRTDSNSRVSREPSPVYEIPRTPGRDRPVESPDIYIEREMLDPSNKYKFTQNEGNVIGTDMGYISEGGCTRGMGDGTTGTGVKSEGDNGCTEQQGIIYESNIRDSGGQS